MSANPLLERLKANEPTYVFSVRMSRTAAVVTLAEEVGYHGVYVDLQHSSISIDTCAQICWTALHSDITAFVRVPSLEPGLISRVLDAGAQGILAPDIRSGAAARGLVEAAMIAPLGDRSVGGGVANPRFRGLKGAALARAVNEATLLIAMIETEEGVEAAADIAGTEGISAIQIGSNDLTTSMGIPGDFLNERVMRAYEKVITACRTAGKPLIIGGIRAADQLAPYVRMGAARCYFTGTDSVFMLEGARKFMAEAKKADAVIAES
jgi:2-keto-3-deoxy-L-rhamnonate aldolase RhmA